MGNGSFFATAAVAAVNEWMDRIALLAFFPFLLFYSLSDTKESNPLVDTGCEVRYAWIFKEY